MCATSAHSPGQYYLCKLQSELGVHMASWAQTPGLMKVCVKIVCGCYQD